MPQQGRHGAGDRGGFREIFRDFGNAAQHPTKDHGAIELSVAPEGRVAVDGRKASLETLGEILKGRVTVEDPVVTIDCDEAVRMGTVFQLHAVLRGAGLLKVKYAGSGAGRLPLILPSEELIEKTKSIPAAHIAQLEVAAGGKCTFEGAEVQPSALQQAVLARLAEDDKLIISVRMSQDAIYGQYLETLRTLKAAGATRIFVNEPAAP